MIRLRKSSSLEFKFISQGGNNFYLAGPLDNFAIHPTSQLKSGAFIDLSEFDFPLAAIFMSDVT